MLPASKSKSKDKKASKEPQKVASKPSVTAAAGNGVPASAYNPHWGTFHTLEAVPTLSVSALQLNGRFRNMDETDEQNGVHLGTGVEYDSVSNNGSWSGESEEHKDKASNSSLRHEAIAGADNEKREKIRQKNEKKHQRQKERRAQELHERCCGYLMSRKLEALAQQLVAMGFSHERATMALMMNEGQVEESVAWLFEVGEQDDKHRDSNLSGANLKIDISEELAQLADMETRYKLSKQEVERAVVSCEGDLEKAAETLRKMKQELPPGPKPGEIGDPPTVSNGKLSVAAVQNSMKPLPRPNPSAMLQQRVDDRVNDKKIAATMGESLEHGSKNIQALKRTQPKLEWAKGQPVTMATDKRWPAAGLNPVSYSLASSLQASHPPTKMENRFIAVGGELKNLQPGSVGEPVMMMQRPQSANGKQLPVTSVSLPHGTASSWHPTNGIDMMRSNGLASQITSPGGGLTQSTLGSNQFYQLQYQHQFGPGTSTGEIPATNWGIQQQQFVPGSALGDFYGTSRGNNSWNRASASPTIAAASSLGLFSGLGSAGSSGASSPVDWANGGLTMPVDYSNIDWTLDRGLSFPKSSSLMLGLASVMNNSGSFDLDAPGVGGKPAMRLVPPNGNGVSMVRSLQDGVGSEASGAGAREWTSPFEGKDLFSLPRQFVSSPSL